MTTPQHPKQQRQRRHRATTSPWTEPFRTSFDNQQQDQPSKPAQTSDPSQAAAHARNAFANSYSFSPNR